MSSWEFWMTQLGYTTSYDEDRRIERLKLHGKDLEAFWFREDDEALWLFCRQQQEVFDPDEWLSFYNQPVVKIAAILLYCGGWYGRRTELEELFSIWKLDVFELSDRVKAIKFDVPRFMCSLKTHIRITNILKMRKEAV